MKQYRKLLSLFTIFTLVLAMVPMGFSNNGKSDEVNYATDRLIVKFSEKMDKETKDQYKKELDVQSSKKLNAKGLELLKFDKNKALSSMMATLRSKKNVEYVEPDYILYELEVDPYYDELWGLDDDLNIYSVDAPDVWSQTSGDGIIVAVIDSGVDIDHFDLLGQCEPAVAFLNETFYDNYEAVADNDDHGTHVAGTIAAAFNNGIGIAGVAPNATILPIKFLDNGSGYTSDAVLAIEYAKANGADIINASWGGGSFSQTLYDAIEDFEGPFIAAAGNDGEDLDETNRRGRLINQPHYPSSYELDNIIAVAALTNTGSLASYSNYGVDSVDIAAPGYYIYSSIVGGYDYYYGTSMATPHVTGVAALMMSQDIQDKKFDENYSNDIMQGDDIVDFILNNSGVYMGLDISTGSRINAEVLMNAYNALEQTAPDEGSDPPNTAPTVEDGTLSFSDVTTSVITLNWNQADDDYTDVADLSYSAYYSTADNISTYEAISTNGILIDEGSNMTQATLTGLEAATEYFFNVVVTDGEGLSSVYVTNSQMTSDPPPPNTAPTVEDGTLSFSDVTTSEITLNWNQASDDYTDVENLSYSAYYSTADNISTYEAISTNGILIDEGSNITQATLTGLEAATEYFFNVIVTDEEGLSSVYVTNSQMTSDPPPPNTAPTVEDGTLSFSDVSASGITLNWNQASDDYTALTDLSYSAYYSTTDNISTYEAISTNGILIDEGSNMTQATLTGLEAATEYFFNVIVTDEEGLSSIYDTNSQTTLEEVTDPAEIISVTSTNPLDGSRPSPGDVITITFNTLEGASAATDKYVTVNGTNTSYIASGNTITLTLDGDFYTLTSRVRYTVSVPGGLFKNADGVDSIDYQFSFKARNR